jgi:hypothetical protein
MIRRLIGQVPAWAQADHPLLRYELGKARTTTRRGRWLRAVGILLLALLFLAAGYLIATGGLQQPPGQSLSESIHAVIYWPLLALQLLTGILAMTLTVNAVGDETRRQHWDSLRATARGAELALRTRWAATFYRLRPLLVVIIGLRLVLILGILYDLTAFSGRYLNFLLNGSALDVPLALGVVLLSLFMTAALLLPMTSVGLDAALGLLLSTFVRQTTYSALLQVFLILLRVALVGVLAQMMTQFMVGQPSVSPWASLALVFGYGALGDSGLAYLNLGLFGDLWAKSAYGILVCVGLLVFALLQALLADWLVALSVRRAERRG